MDYVEQGQDHGSDINRDQGQVAGGLAPHSAAAKKDGGAMSIQRRLAHHQFRSLHGAGSANPVPYAQHARHARRALNIH